MQKFIKLKRGATIRTGEDDDEFRGLNAGSVVEVKEDMYDLMVSHGLAEPHPGPYYEAPAPEEPADPPKIERADLGEKLARAEHTLAPRQQPKKP
jgi:hypothetical protein